MTAPAVTTAWVLSIDETQPAFYGGAYGPGTVSPCPSGQPAVVILPPLQREMDGAFGRLADNAKAVAALVGAASGVVVQGVDPFRSVFVTALVAALG
jgi:hypothetical protein